MKFKKILGLFGVAIMALPLMFGLGGCKKSNNGGDSSLKVNAKEVYAMSAVTSACYLKHLENGLTSLGAAEATPATSRPANITDADVEGITNCMGLFEGIVNSGGFTQTTSKNTETEGEFKDYNLVMTITMANATNSIKIYYNEKETFTNREIDDDEEEMEVSTILSGVMVVGTSQYDVSGKREVEEEKDEREVSIEFTTKSKTNPQNYIVISQSVETENNEQEIEYEYKIYKNGRLVQETEIEFEQENKKTELEFKLKDLSNGQYNKTVYKLKKAEGINSFIVEINANGKKDTIQIKKPGSVYMFTYSNGYTENVEF